MQVMAFKKRESLAIIRVKEDGFRRKGIEEEHEKEEIQGGWRKSVRIREREKKI